MKWAAGPGQVPPGYVRPPPPKKAGGGCLRVILVLMGLSFLFCCCFVTAVVESADDPMNWEQVVQVPPTLGPSTSLGVALIPETLAAAQARTHVWRKRLDAYSLGYGLSSEEHQTVDDDFAALSDEFSYAPGVGTNFTWAPPAQCRNGKEWSCVFSSLARDNASRIAPLTELFRRRQQAEHLDARQTTELVVSFVQGIKYRLPTEATAAFGLLPPAVVVADGSGDCDSKALLAVIMLRQLGIDANVLLASGLGHASLGVALPGTGKKFALGRSKYLFVEVTTPGWPVGTVPPEYDVANAWKVIPVDVP